MLKENSIIYISYMLCKIIIINDKTVKKAMLSSARYSQRNRKTVSKIKIIIYRE